MFNTNMNYLYRNIAGKLKINNSNIKSLVKAYITNKNDLPYNIREVPIAIWDVSQVTDMSALFKGYSEFNEPIGQWNVSNVKNMTEIFRDCTNFDQQLYWNVSNVKNMEGMFHGCSNYNQPLKSPDGGNWNVENVENMSSMFHDCINFDQELIWNTQNLTNTHSTFYGCTNFNQELNWNVSKVYSVMKMFSGCASLNKPLNLNFNFQNTLLLNSMFEGCINFNQSLNNWDVSNIIDMQHMFAGCRNFNKPLNNWNVERVTTMFKMFEGCTNFNQSLNNWNVTQVRTMTGMFKDCTNFNQPLNNWNVRNVRYMAEMFKNCINFNKPLNRWSLRSAEFIDNIFENCRISEANKPRLPITETVQQEPRIQVDARQIHKAATKIQYAQLNNFLLEKTGESLPNNLDKAGYINNTIKMLISESDEPIEIKKAQRIGLERIMNERLYGVSYVDLSSDIKNSIFACLSYVKSQSPIFKKTYVETFIKDCVHAYEGPNGMSCAGGAVERIIFSLLPACASENNPDCKTIVPLITGIEEFIIDWFKLQSPGYKTGSSSSSNDIEPLPPFIEGSTDPEKEPVRQARKANLRKYLLTKLPGQEVIIDEAIEKWAQPTEYEDDYFTYENKGGRRRSRKRGKKNGKKNGKKTRRRRR